MNKKYLLLSFGTVTTIVTPIALAVSCGKKNKNTNGVDLKTIKLDFTSDVKSLVAIKDFKNDFYDAQINSKDHKEYEVDLSLPIGDYKISLAPNELSEVQQGKVDTKSGEISFDDFISTMKSTTGTAHQYSYAKPDALKLGTDKGGFLNGKDQHDEAFQKQWLMDNLIKTMPAGVSISKIEAHTITNNMIVTFTDGTKTDDVDFHLKDEKTQADADAANAKGGSWFYRAFKAVENPIQKVIGEVKTLAHFGHVNNNITEKDIFTDVAKTVADLFVDKLGDMIPVYGEITKLPIIGDKVQDFVHTHTVEPIVDAIANKI